MYDHHGWRISNLHYTDVKHPTNKGPVHCDEPYQYEDENKTDLQ